MSNIRCCNGSKITVVGNATSGWNSTDCKYGSCLRFDRINDDNMKDLGENGFDE